MIDFDNRIIKGKKNTYVIEPENLKVGRYNEFLLQGILLAWNTDFASLYNSWREIVQLATNGNNILGALTSIAEKAKKNVEGIESFAQNSSPAIIRYCSLFCNQKDEDTSIYDPVIAKMKYDDWGNIPISDFFLLAARSTQYLPQSLSLLMQSQNEEANKNIT